MRSSSCKRTTIVFPRLIFGKIIFMRTNLDFPDMPASKLLYAVILLAGTIGNILLSPKWAIPVVAWIAPGLMLFYFRYTTARFKVLWFILALIVAQVISSYDVAPFPLLILVIVSLIDVLKIFAVYQIDRWITRRNNHF